MAKRKLVQDANDMLEPHMFHEIGATAGEAHMHEGVDRFRTRRPNEVEKDMPSEIIEEIDRYLEPVDLVCFGVVNCRVREIILFAKKGAPL
jgi:hypothetical protein